MNENACQFFHAGIFYVDGNYCAPRKVRITCQSASTLQSHHD